MIKYIVRCPCIGYEEEFTNYQDAQITLKYKNMHGCCKDCYPHRHKFLTIEDKNVENEEKIRENTLEVSQKASKTKFFQLDLSDMAEVPEKIDKNDPE